MKDKDTYILITKDKYQITCDGFELFWAIKLLFETLKSKNPEFHTILCEKLKQNQLV